MVKIKKINMKCIILAGGKGSRLSELTKSIPKPMVKISDKPIIFHIMNHYRKYGIKEFIIAAGYKKNIIENYFKKRKFFDWKIKIVDTGLKTMTGGRLKRLEKYIDKDEDFLFTYGDGISNVNIKKLIKFHLKEKKILTVTAVHPPARFGEIVLNRNLVKSFKEKPQVKNGWINGGFFVSNYKFFKFIKKDSDILEKTPLENLCKKKQLAAFKHGGFWKCMDTIRDRDVLIDIYKKNEKMY
jgi:glucose-1-phosphate cytidylyltransferase